MKALPPSLIICSLSLFLLSQSLCNVHLAEDSGPTPKNNSPNKSPKKQAKPANQERHLQQSGPSAMAVLNMKRANEEYQRSLREYLKKFRNEQMAIAARFEETFDNLLVDIEAQNKKQFMMHVGDIASSVADKNRKHAKIYNQFNRLKIKKKNDWMFPKI